MEEQNIWRTDLLASLIMIDLSLIVYSLDQTIKSVGLKYYLYLIFMVYCIFVLFYTVIMENKTQRQTNDNLVKDRKDDTTN